MSQGLSNPATLELTVQRELRARIEEEIRKRQITHEQMAKELDLLPSGAQALMERKEWSIEIALRIAQCLKVETGLEVKPNS